MDERVYEVVVCPECFAQLFHDADGNYDPCSECISTKETTVRFLVPRASVLRLAQPRQSLIERTLYFGCVDQPGHYYWHRSRDGHPYKAQGYGAAGYAGLTPWGHHVDGGLLPRNEWTRDGVAHVVHKDAWTAVVFADSSVDKRPGSWSVYCIPELLDGPEALAVAREAFPTIFARYEFPVELAR